MKTVYTKNMSIVTPHGAIWTKSQEYETREEALAAVMEGFQILMTNDYTVLMNDSGEYVMLPLGTIQQSQFKANIGTKMVNDDYEPIQDFSTTIDVS